MNPVAAAQRAAYAALTAAARKTDCTASMPPDTAVRFRADGKGGELAMPILSGANPDVLIAAISPEAWFEAVFPSGDWIGWNLSDAWRETVRQSIPEAHILHCELPDMPTFPARLDADAWRLDALLGITDPLISARLDSGNPARRIRLAQRRAAKYPGDHRADRQLVNEGAALLQALETADAAHVAAAMLTLAERYLSMPGEDMLCARLLDTGLRCLSV